MARPLMQHGVGQLEELFATSKMDHKVLEQLEHELQYRQVPRAVALLAEVQAVMYGKRTSAPLAPAPVRPSAPTFANQSELWVRPARSPVASPPPVTAALAAPLSPPGPPVPAPPTMPLDDAYKLLKATPGSTWESIEETRRLLVRESRPERLKGLPADKRGLALAEAKRVNGAYLAVSQARCAGR